MKISEILDAALDHLWDGANDRCNHEEFSCLAIRCAFAAVRYSNAGRGARWSNIERGLRAMGLDPDGSGEFAGIPRGPQRQQARALWLTWAKLMAEEQGL